MCRLGEVQFNCPFENIHLIKISAYLHICSFAHLKFAYQKKMILVTGATGFLGAEVVKQLAEQGHHVRCTKRGASVISETLNAYRQNIEWVGADLLDVPAMEDAFEGITQVYNCAAFVSLRSTDKEPMIYTNVTGTANLVNLCLEHNCRLIHVSSVAAVGHAKPGELTTEKHHLDQAL